MFESTFDYLKEFYLYVIKEHITYENISKEKGSIKRYDLDWLLLIGWFIPREGSVFSPLQQIALSGVLIAVTTVLAHFACDISDTSVISFSNRCVALPVPNTNYLTLSTLCSFVVAFFANTVITRWWNTRLYMQSAIARSTILLSSICAALTAKIVNGPLEERESRTAFAKIFCCKVRGYLCLGIHLLINHARSKKDLDDLVERDVLSQEDVDYFHALSGAPLNAYSLLSRVLEEAASSDMILNTNANLLKFERDLTFLCSTCGMVGDYIDTQLSFPFVQIFTAVVYAFMIQLIYVSSSFVAVGMRENDKSTMILGYLTITLYSVVLLGVLKIADVLENPLGKDTADLPCDTMMVDLEKMSMELIDDAFEELSKDDPLLTDVPVLIWMVQPDLTQSYLSFFIDEGGGSKQNDASISLAPPDLMDEEEEGKVSETTSMGSESRGTGSTRTPFKKGLLEILCGIGPNEKGCVEYAIADKQADKNLSPALERNEDLDDISRIDDSALVKTEGSETKLLD